MKDDYADAVAALGCLICGQLAQLHHCKGGSMREVGVHKGWGQKTGDENIIPLCLDHHTGANGIHTIGVLTWEACYGAQREWLAYVGQRIGPAPARAPRKPKKPHPKILPRRHA